MTAFVPSAGTPTLRYDGIRAVGSDAKKGVAPAGATAFVPSGATTEKSSPMWGDGIHPVGEDADAVRRGGYCTSHKSV